jgi:ketosteroid isomerase-like protein
MVPIVIGTRIRQRSICSMKQVFAILLFIVSITSFSQDVQKEINEQVWRPFIKNFNEGNTAGFMAVHSKDVVRSPRDQKAIWNWEEYNQQQAQGDAEDKKENRKRTLELRFTERIANGDLAFHVGIYKTTYVFPDGKTQSYFGRFHVVLRKEKNVWKILVDTDSTEDHTIEEKDYLAATPLEE